VVADLYDHMRSQIPSRLPYQVAQGEIIVSYVSALAYRRQDDYVFTHNVSEAGLNKARDVHGTHSPKALHPMRA
jgi:predicted solute-binding protein